MKREELRKHFQAEAKSETAEQQFKKRTVQLDALEDTLIEGFNTLIRFVDGKTTKTEVVNQLKSISTPDVDKVVTALSKLDSDILSNKLDLKPVVDALNGMKRELGLIPKTHPKAVEQKDSFKITNLDEIELDTSDVVKAIKDLKLVAEAPIINERDVDLKPLQNVMLDLLKAVKAQKPVKIPDFPEIPKTDLKKVEDKLDESIKHLKAIVEKPTGGGGGGGNSTPYQDSTGKLTYVDLEEDASLPVTIKNPGDIGGGSSQTAYLIKNISPPTDPEISTYKYFGFIQDGSTNWRIMRKTLSDNSFAYATGVSSYSTNWTGRAGLTYA